VDEACISLLALYQPAGRDLRLVATALKIVKDLERVGDIAKSVARHGRRLAHDRPIPCPPGLVDMAEVARGLLRRALDAFVDEDVALAREVMRDDDEVDSFHRENLRRLIQTMVDDPSSIGPLTQYLSVNKLLERIGDHSSNIAAMVVYMVEGRDIRHLKKQQAAGRL
jgi:phosphate transport system protein